MTDIELWHVLRGNWQSLYRRTLGGHFFNQFRHELTRRYRYVARDVAARFYANMNASSTNDDLVYVKGLAGIFLGAAIDRYNPDTGIGFNVFATVYITHRINRQPDLDIESAGIIFSDSDDAFDLPTQRKRQWDRWGQPINALLGGLTQQDWTVLGLHLVESWNTSDIARRLNTTESEVQQTLTTAAARIDQQISQEVAHV